MNKKRVIMMLSALTLVSSHTLADTQPQGKLSIDRDGIKVWTFKQSGNPIMNNGIREHIIWRSSVSHGHRSLR
jgi:hypothetical protein